MDYYGRGFYFEAGACSEAVSTYSGDVHSKARYAEM